MKKVIDIIVSAWGRLPLLVRAVVSGLTVFFVLQTGWTALMLANLKMTHAIPWAVPLGLIYLWVAFRFFNGNWGPGSRSDRSMSMRARRLNRTEWRMAIPGCVSVMIFFIAATVLSYRIVEVPAEEMGVPELPWWSLYSVLIMISIVAGVSEEAGFRGYLQKPLEDRYGPILAIGVSAVVFWLAHLNHVNGVARAPALIAMGASLGALAYCSRSVLPAMLTHATADSIIFVASTAELPPHYLWHPQLLKETGLDGFFWVVVVAMLLSAIVMFVSLRRLRRGAGHRSAVL